jgi:nucleoid-associated protein YgaU
MPKTEKAYLVELKDGRESGKKVTVQFNPETLRVSYSNHVVLPAESGPKGAPGATAATGDQRGNAALQHPGRGTTHMSVQLWFDVSGVMPQGKEKISDVRDLTNEVIYFIKAQEGKDGAPPQVRFHWGTFKFDGVLDSIEESLEFFAANGVPLRASMSLGMTQNDIVITGGGDKGLGPGGLPSPGTKPLFQAQAGVSLQALAAANLGVEADWQAIATANNIENPRLLEPGQVIDMNVSGTASASASASFRVG